MINHNYSFRKQNGVVLMISLVMLVLLTIIGITGANVTGLQEKMAGNMRDENLAFQAAESALRAGESAVILNPPSFSVSNNGKNGTGLYTTIGTDAQASGYWQNSSLWTTICQSTTSASCPYATYSGGNLDHVTTLPRYIIEELPTSTGGSSSSSDNDSLEPGVPTTPQTTAWYRITARGTGGSDNAVVLLQSIIKR